MASKHTFQLVHQLHGDLQSIYDQVLDLRKFGALHPNMKEVKVIRERPNEFVDYEVLEEVKLFGLIKIKPNYSAQVFEIEKLKHLQYFSQVEKNVFLTINFYFSQNTALGTVQIVEEVEVTANKFVASIFLNILKKAHMQVFNTLNQKH